MHTSNGVATTAIPESTALEVACNAKTDTMRAFAGLVNLFAGMLNMLGIP